MKKNIKGEKMIKVSIIVPIYNKERYLKKNIESLLNQSLREIEIILINDGSNDMSENICRYYKKKDNRIIYIKTSNKGVCSARNKGLEVSKGKYCIFIDADDFIENSMLEEMYKLIIEKNAETVICGMKESNSKKVFSQNISFNIDIQEKEYNFFEIIKMNSILLHSTGNKLFSREILEKNNILFVENIHGFEDLNFIFKYFLFSQKNYILEKGFYNYLRNEDSITKSTKTLQKKKFLETNLNNLKIFFDMKEFLYKKNKIEFISLFEYKLKEFDICNLGYKNLQNFYIKDKEMELSEFVDNCRKYEECTQNLFNLKINKLLRVRLLIIIIFRKVLFLGYKKYLNKKWRGHEK